MLAAHGADLMESEGEQREVLLKRIQAAENAELIEICQSLQSKVCVCVCVCVCVRVFNVQGEETKCVSA